MSEVSAGTLDGLAPGTSAPHTLDGHAVLVCRTKNGAVYAVENRCSHAFSRLTRGKLRGTKIFCPLHGAPFDLCTGAALGAPASAPIRTYAVRVEDGAILVEIPDTTAENSQK